VGHNRVDLILQGAVTELITKRRAQSGEQAVKNTGEEMKCPLQAASTLPGLTSHHPVICFFLLSIVIPVWKSIEFGTGFNVVSFGELLCIFAHLLGYAAYWLYPVVFHTVKVQQWFFIFLLLSMSLSLGMLVLDLFSDLPGYSYWTSGTPHWPCAGLFPMSHNMLRVLAVFAPTQGFAIRSLRHVA
jgi:hypothetical protein